MERQEKHNIEWKSVWKDAYLGGICAFATAQGGNFFIGIDDNGKIIGVENSKKLLESLPSKIRDAMGIVVDINLVPIYICVSNTKTVYLYISRIA